MFGSSANKVFCTSSCPLVAMMRLRGSQNSALFVVESSSVGTRTWGAVLCEGAVLELLVVAGLFGLVLDRVYKWISE